MTSSSPSQAAGSRVYVLGTADTKAEELGFLRDILRERGVDACIVDVSTHGSASGSASATPRTADITAHEVAECHPDGTDAVFCGERGRAIAGMSAALARFLATRTDISGAIGIGGSGGTALIAPGLQALPIGMPKIMVSTVAAGNVGPYVGESDLDMIYPVVDLQGLNRISRAVLRNAANAMAGMVRHPTTDIPEKRPAIGITMFGVTTPCVTAAVSALETQFECLVFHATGAGGKSMERLVGQGVIGGVLDITTTEFCDLVAGGIFPCENDRLDVIARTRVPYVGSCGGLDMVNFGPMESVPERYRDRRLVAHNPFITLMRTNVDECRMMGRMIGERLNRCEGPVRFLYPEGGFSLLDRPGEPFHDPEADAAFRDALLSTLEQTPQRRFESLPHALNDPAFAEALATEMARLFKENEAHAPD